MYPVRNFMLKSETKEDKAKWLYYTNIESKMCLNKFFIFY